MLEIINVSKRYDNRLVLREISCAANSGEIVVVTGPNGSGKSTLLKILCGLLSPSSGEVVWRLADQPHSAKAILRRVGYVSPDVGLYDRLSAYEHLDIFARIRGVQCDRQDIDTLLERVHLLAVKSQPVGEFSSGMKQRVKLALAMVCSPGIMVLDEPSSNLDDAGRKLVRELIYDVKAKGLVILATNEAQEVAEYGQTVLRLA